MEFPNKNPGYPVREGKISYPLYNDQIKTVASHESLTLTLILKSLAL